MRIVILLLVLAVLGCAAEDPNRPLPKFQRGDRVDVYSPGLNIKGVVDRVYSYNVEYSYRVDYFDKNGNDTWIRQPEHCLSKTKLTPEKE